MIHRSLVFLHTKFAPLPNDPSGPPPAARLKALNKSVKHETYAAWMARNVEPSARETGGFALELVW